MMQTQFFEDSPPFKRALCQHTWCTHVDKCCNKIDKSSHSSAFPNIECCWLGRGWVIWPEGTNVIGEINQSNALFLFCTFPIIFLYNFILSVHVIVMSIIIIIWNDMCAPLFFDYFIPPRDGAHNYIEKFQQYTRFTYEQSWKCPHKKLHV